MVSYKSTFQIRQVLRTLGFSDNEIKILLLLFNIKKATAQKISRQTTVSLSSTQYCLKNLSARGLVKIVPDREDYFEIASEKVFFGWIDEQEKKHQQLYENAKGDLQSFLEVVQKNSWKPGVTYYEGREGILEIYKDMLETAESTNKKIFGWLDIPTLREVLGDFLYEYIDTRAKKGIVSHDIVPDNPINRGHDHNKENRKLRYVKNMPINGEIRIYGDKVAVMTFDKKKPVGFVFQGELVTSLFKTIFNGYWEGIKN